MASDKGGILEMMSGLAMKPIDAARDLLQQAREV
jgi:hypothetical protein